MKTSVLESVAVDDDVRELNVAELTQRVIDAAVTTTSEDVYPLEAKDGGSFRSTFEGFWEKAITATVQEGLLFDHAEMFELLFGWVATVSAYVFFQAAWC